MQIILQEDVQNLGKKGEVKDVAPGYARNHLLPRGLAVEATPQRLKEWEKRRKKEEKINKEKEEHARKLAEKITNTNLTFQMPAGDGGRLFGSVTASDIATKLSEAGVDIERKSIELPEPIKSVGEHQAVIRLYPGIKADLKITVEGVE